MGGLPDLASPRGDLLQFTANWRTPWNFALSLDRPGRRFELRPFEAATVYEQAARDRAVRERATPFDPPKLARLCAELRQQVESLQARGVRVTLMELPHDPQVMATPRYRQVSSAVQNRWHSPNSVDPETTPEESAEFLSAVLSGEALL